MIMSSNESMSFKNVEEMLEDRNAEDHGRYFLCDCPDCDEHEAFIYKNNPKMIMCNRAEECGEKTFVRYENVKSAEEIRMQNLSVSYPDLSTKQAEALDWSRRAFEHVQKHTLSPTLDEGYRGISKEISKEYIVDFVDEEIVKHMFNKMKPLWEKDYSKSSFMHERNIILPILDEKGHVDRMLLRSSINPDASPKEIQLVVNPSKESRDFFIELNNYSDVVVITEALFDGLSFKEIDPDVSFISLTGSTKTRQLTEYMKSNKESLEDKNISFALDDDKAGREAMDVLIGMVEKYEIGADWNIMNYPINENMKDPNDFLQEDRELFKGCYEQSINELKKDKKNHKEKEVNEIAY